MNRKMRASFLALMMIVSVFAGVVALSGGVAAQSTIDSAGNPDDIPGGTASASQNVTAGTPGTNITLSGSEFKEGNQHAIKLDLTDLQGAGADLSSASLSTSINSSGSVDFQNIAPSAGEARLIVTNGTAGEKIGLQLTIDNISTDGVTTAQNLEYTITADANNSGDFGSNFQSNAIAQTDPFGIATIEVENLDQNDQISTTTLTEAINEANSPNNLAGSASDQIEIRPNEGTYTLDTRDLDNNAITADNTRIVPTNGASVTIENADSGAETLNISASNVELQNLYFDQASSNNVALNVSAAGAEATVENSVFNNSGATNTPLVNVTDGVSSLTVDGSTFEDGSNNNQGINLTATSGGVDLTVTNNEFVDLDQGLNVSDPVDGPTDINTVDVSNNIFNGSDTHVEDSDDQLDLNAVFNSNNNEFNPFVTIEDNNGDIQTGIYGDLATANNGAGINNADHTTTFTGEHTADEISITNDGITLQAASGAETANITSNGEEILQLGPGGDSSSIDTLTVDGVVFDLDGSDEPAVVAFGANNDVTDLSVTDSQIVDIGGTTNASINVTQVNLLDGVDISDNEFVSSNNYDAVNISAGTLASQSAVDIRNNVVEDADSGQAVFGFDGQIDDGNLEITVVNNELLNLSSAATGIDVDVDNSGDEVTIQNNLITGDGDATGIQVDGADPSGVSVTSNEITGLDDGSGSDAVAIDLVDDNDDNTATVEDNTLETNEVHFSESTTDDYDEQTLIDNNLITGTIKVLDEEGGDIQTDAVYGTVTASVDAASGGEFIDVGSATYEEDSITINTNNYEISAADGATLTTEESNPFFEIDSPGATTISGFTYSPAEDNNAADILITDADAATTIENSVFEGPGTDDRTAIDINEVTSTNPVTISDNEISDYGTGVLVEDTSSDDASTNATVNIVRNEFSGSATAVDVQSLDDDANNEGHIVRTHFNDITDNEVGINNELAIGTSDGDANVTSARANWWGDESGPSGDAYPGDGDEISGSADAGLATSPRLTESYTALPTERFVVIDDPEAPLADESDSPDVLVTVLNDTKAGDTDSSTARVLADPSGPIDGAGVADRGTGAASGGSAADPLLYTGITASEPGDYTLTVLDSDGDVQTGSAVQTFTGRPDGVEVTAERDTLVADDDTTVNVTMTVVDSNGNPVAVGSEDVEFLIDNSTNAGVTKVTEETATDDSSPNSEARLEISAENEDFELEVTGLFDSDDSTNAGGSSATATITTTLDQLEVDVSPDTVTADEETDVTVNVSSASSGNAVQNAQVLFSGQGVSESTVTDADGLVTATVAPESSGTVDINVTSDGFENASATITVEEAGTGSPLDGPAGRFDNNADGDISITELGDAGTAFAQGDLTIAELGAVGQEFAS